MLESIIRLGFFFRIAQRFIIVFSSSLFRTTTAVKPSLALIFQQIFGTLDSRILRNYSHRRQNAEDSLKSCDGSKGF